MRTCNNPIGRRPRIHGLGFGPRIAEARGVNLLRYNLSNRSSANWGETLWILGAGLFVLWLGA